MFIVHIIGKRRAYLISMTGSCLTCFMLGNTNSSDKINGQCLILWIFHQALTATFIYRPVVIRLVTIRIWTLLERTVISHWLSCFYCNFWAAWAYGTSFGWWWAKYFQQSKHRSRLNSDDNDERPLLPPQIARYDRWNHELHWMPFDFVVDQSLFGIGRHFLHAGHIDIFWLRLCCWVSIENVELEICAEINDFFSIMRMQFLDLFVPTSSCQKQSTRHWKKLSCIFRIIRNRFSTFTYAKLTRKIQSRRHTQMDNNLRHRAHNTKHIHRNLCVAKKNIVLFIIQSIKKKKLRLYSAWSQWEFFRWRQDIFRFQAQSNHNFVTIHRKFLSLFESAITHPPVLTKISWDTTFPHHSILLVVSMRRHRFLESLNNTAVQQKKKKIKSDPFFSHTSYVVFLSVIGLIFVRDLNYDPAVFTTDGLRVKRTKMPSKSSIPSLVSYNSEKLSPSKNKKFHL